MKSQFPTLDQEIELFDGLKMETDLATINSRIDVLIVQLTGMVSAPASLSDKTAEVTTGILTDVISNIPEVIISANNMKCVIGSKIYTAYLNSGKINFSVYDTVTNTFSNLATTVDSASDMLSIAPDVANNKLYVLSLFNPSLYDPDTNTDVTSTIYVYDIDGATTTLVTTIATAIYDTKICYKNGKLYLSPGQDLAWDENEWMMMPTSYAMCKNYTIATSTWATTTLQANTYPANYVVKYKGGMSDTTNDFFEVLPSLHGENVELWTWYFGDTLASKLLIYNRYEMNTTLPYGIAVCLNASKEYVIKNVWRSDVNYLLMHNVTNKVAKRIVLSGPTLINPDSILICVGTKLFIFDPNVLTKISTLDLTPYL